MKFLLVSVVLLVGSSLAVPVVRRVRRDILPGDPRYGTDYHHHHHHAHGDHHDHSHGQVQVSKATGNYVGSYLAPAPVYGPPGYQPGTPLGPQNTPVFAGTYQQPAQVHNHYHHVPASTYGVPSQQEHHHYSVPQPSAPTTTKVTPTVSQPIDSYGSPISTNVNHHHHHESVQTVQQPTRSYLTPVIESKKPEATVNTKVLYNQPKVNNAYLEPTVRSPATSVPRFVPESRPVQRSQVTVETVPATLLHEYTTVVRDESVGEAPSGPSIPNFPASFPNFEVPQVPDFLTASQGFTDNFSNFGENYENFVSNFNTNGFNFPSFGTQTNEKVESAPLQSAPVVKQADEPVTETQSVVVENHQHEHHDHHQQHQHQEHQHQEHQHQHQEHQHQHQEHQHQQYQYPQPTANKETQQLVDTNGGYVY